MELVAVQPVFSLDFKNVNVLLEQSAAQNGDRTFTYPRLLHSLWFKKMQVNSVALYLLSLFAASRASEAVSAT